MNPRVSNLPAGFDIGGNAMVTDCAAGGDGSGGVMLYATGGKSSLHWSPAVAWNAPPAELIGVSSCCKTKAHSAAPEGGSP